MRIYADIVVLLNFAVDFLLLLGTNRLTGHPLLPGRAALASAFGGLYSGACLVSSLAFLGGTLWRLVSLCAMGSIAFGWNPGSLRRTAAFTLLSMALGGLALGMGKPGFLPLLTCAGGLYGLCVLGLGRDWGKKRYASVTLRHNGVSRTLTALRDTGNLLRDPVTGWPVLVAGAETARDLLGLKPEELADPVGTLGGGKHPGLRLIPYRAVGTGSGFLLGMKLDEVQIDGKVVEQIVAFAGESFWGDGCQALTGGNV